MESNDEQCFFSEGGAARCPDHSDQAYCLHKVSVTMHSPPSPSLLFFILTSHHDTVSLCWDFVCNDCGGNLSVTKSHCWLWWWWWWKVKTVYSAVLPPSLMIFKITSDRCTHSASSTQALVYQFLGNLFILSFSFLSQFFSFQLTGDAFLLIWLGGPEEEIMKTLQFLSLSRF